MHGERSANDGTGDDVEVVVCLVGDSNKKVEGYIYRVSRKKLPGF